jgi:hypothetical protein
MAKLPVPFFPEPPEDYNRGYMGQVVRSFAIYARQILAPLQLVTKTDDASAAEDGVLMWDAVNGYPTVSKDDEWRQLVIANGYAQFIQDNDITAAAADTAYSITYDDPGFADGVSRDGTNPERIVFGEGGMYLLSFTAQISSTSGSTVSFRFWPRINGVDATGSTILAKLHQNDASTVVSRSALFQVSAGDYLEVMWATSNTAGTLIAHAATGYAPAAPSTTLAVTRIRA